MDTYINVIYQPSTHKDALANDLEDNYGAANSTAENVAGYQAGDASGGYTSLCGGGRSHAPQDRLLDDEELKELVVTEV